MCLRMKEDWKLFTDRDVPLPLEVLRRGADDDPIPLVDWTA